MSRFLLSKVLLHWAPGLIAIGLSLCAWAIVEIQLSQVPQALPIVLPSKTPMPTVKPTSSPNPTPTPSVDPLPSNVGTAVYPFRPDNGQLIGTITLQNLGLSWPIHEGTTDLQLSRGVGHFRASVLPGENDNSVLSGHRATVFNRLGELRVGQTILVRTVAGTFTYRITGTRIVLRTDRTVIVHTPHAVLTLTTCYPFNAIGLTTHAYIVSADLERY